MLSEYFIDAVSDYLYLLEKNYPQKLILKIVGDRYQLSGTERSMLYRGIQRTEDCENRKMKICAGLTQNVDLFIDGYNVIRTIGSYLLGLTVFISMDGYLRDASEMHRATLKKSILEQTLKLRKPGQGVAGFVRKGFNEDGDIVELYDPGFIQGAAGIGLALLAAAVDLEPAWDRIILLS